MGNAGRVGFAGVRDIYSRGGSESLASLLQSLFVAECIQPSSSVWVVSAWISDIELIDNRARQFSMIDLTWPASYIRFSQVLGAMMKMGTIVNIVTNTDENNIAILENLRRQGSGSETQLKVFKSPTLHEKGILTDHFVIDGSMNFTFSGIRVNEEHVTFRIQPEVIAERRIHLENRWSSAHAVF